MCFFRACYCSVLLFIQSVCTYGIILQSKIVKEIVIGFDYGV